MHFRNSDFGCWHIWTYRTCLRKNYASAASRRLMAGWKNHGLTENPAHHFLNNGLRLQEFHDHVYMPLREHGALDLIAQHSAPDNTEEFFEYHYLIQNTQIIIFEGIFLFQPMFSFDYSIWVECSYETALERALKRNQEGLNPDELIHDFSTIYHAAQKLHIQRDDPKSRADFIYLNDTD